MCYDGAGCVFLSHQDRHLLFIFLCLFIKFVFCFDASNGTTLWPVGMRLRLNAQSTRNQSLQILSITILVPLKSRREVQSQFLIMQVDF